MSQGNKRYGIGFDAQDEPSAKRPKTASDEFIEQQKEYAKIRAEIEAQFFGEREKAFIDRMTVKERAKIRRGMELELQEENRKALEKQKGELVRKIAAVMRKEIEKEVGLLPGREEKMRERIRKEIVEEQKEERKREIEKVKREMKYECEEKITTLEERIRELEEKYEKD